MLSLRHLTVLAHSSRVTYVGLEKNVLYYHLKQCSTGAFAYCAELIKLKTEGETNQLTSAPADVRRDLRMVYLRKYGGSRWMVIRNDYQPRGCVVLECGLVVEGNVYFKTHI
jgi:hypothetical protein